MAWQGTPYIILLIVAAAASVASVLYVWSRRPIPGNKTAVLIALAGAVWMLGYALELVSVDISAKVFWNKVQYVGIVIALAAWLVFVLQYTGRERWLTRRTLALLSIEPFITLLLVFTNEAHGLIWGPVVLDTYGPFLVLARSHGVGFWIHIVYTYTLFFIVIFLLIQMLIRSRHLYRRQASVLLFAALLPLLGSALMLLDLNPFPYLDLTPLAFTMSSLVLTWSLFSLRVGDIVPVARGVVIESMSDGVIVLDEQDRIVDMNPVVQHIVGRTAAETIGQPVEQVWPDWSHLTERSYDETGMSEGAVLRLLDTQRIYDVRLSPIVDWRGRLTSRVVVLRDVTERKRAEEEIRQRTVQLEALEEAAAAISSTLHFDRVLDHILEQVERVVEGELFNVMLIDGDNARVARWRGYDRAGVVPPSLVGPFPIAGFPGLVRMAQTGQPLVVPDTATGAEWARSGIPEIACSYVGAPIRVGDLAVGFLNVMSTQPGQFDTADARWLQAFADHAATAIENARLHRELLDYAGQLEERVQERTAQLQAQYARLEAILRSVSDGIVVTDVEGGILQTNPVARTWLTRSLSPEDAAWLREAVQELAQRADERPEEVLELKGLDLELKAAPILRPEIEAALRPDFGEALASSVEPLSRATRGKPAVVVAIHDVSELKALDRMKTRFVSNVSHELRTPVTTIKLYAHLMRQQPEKWEKYLAPLVQEADHQARLVQDILQISRIDAGRVEMRPRPTSINELAEAVVANRQVLARDWGLTLEHRPAESGLSALVDPGRMKQVLDNLVENAIRYTPKGGKVVVSTGKEEAAGRVWVTATVADTGMGIPEEELPHVFDRFFRGEGPQMMQIPGTGLGLTIVGEIVELHGGRVTVESRVGKGTTFTVWLPLADAGRELGSNDQ